MVVLPIVCTNIFYINSYITEMKLFKTLALCGVVAIAANAQAEEAFAPEEGDFSIELQFNPFSNNFKTFQIDQLTGRYMVSNSDALRFGIGFGVDNQKITPDPDNDDVEAWGKSTTGNFSLDLGYERHFYSNGRVDLYAGAGLGYRLTTASGKVYSKEDGEDAYEKKYHNITLATDEHGTPVYGSDRTSHTFRVTAFTGIDFYVYRGLYVGAELGIRFGVTSYPGYYTETKDGRDAVKSDKMDKETSISFKTLCEPALRLGWKF